MINSLQDLQILVCEGETNWKQYGEVNATYQDGMVLFNYTAVAQYQRRWNFFECISRGLILDAVTGQVIARPFDKFWNWGERENNTPIVDIAEKMDGSLGVHFRFNGQHRIATRGSFNSDQARWATTYLNANHNLAQLSDDLTLLFEVIYPENRVVVDYKGRRELVLIGARSRSTGQDYSTYYVDAIAAQYNFHRPKNYSFDTIFEVIDAARSLSPNEEGWVVRFADGGRLKIKGDAYRLAHRIMTGVTFNRVLEAVRDGNFDQMIEGVPDEFLGQIRAWKAEIDREVATIAVTINGLLIGAPEGTQKDFALWVQANTPKSMHAYLFAAKAGRDITPLIYRKGFENRPNSDKPQAEAEG